MPTDSRFEELDLREEAAGYSASDDSGPSQTTGVCTDGSFACCSYQCTKFC
jgi:hypothetical protein